MHKVLFITSSLDRNGTETFIINVFRCIDREKYMFDFLLFTESINGYYNEVQKYGSKIYRLPARKDGLFKYKKKIKEFFELHSKEYTVIHWCGCSLTSILPIYYAYIFDIPIRIIHAHSSNVKGLHNRVLHCVNKMIISKIGTHFLACSQLAANFFFRGTRCYGKYLIIKNGINLDKFQYNVLIRNKFRKELGLVDKFVIGHVGQFTKVKNHLFIIDIFVELLKREPSSVLLLLGVGEDLEIIKQKVIGLHLQDNVHFLGLREDVNRLLQTMDCFLFPSFYEGLPFALVEAQAAGLPAYTSTNVSREVNLTGNVHFFDLQNTAEEWAKKILLNKHIRNNVNDLIVRKGYSIRETVNKLINIYEGK